MSRAEELYQQAAAGSFQPQEYETKSGFSTWQGFPARPTVEDLARVKEAAELGYPEAQYQMALYYLFAKEDAPSAIRRAAGIREGETADPAREAEAKAKGRKILDEYERDAKEAVRLLEEALRGGIGEAGLLLGDLCRETAHISAPYLLLAGNLSAVSRANARPGVDSEKASLIGAMEYYEAGADQGCGDAMYWLGLSYMAGIEGEKDADKAFACYVEAQKNGSELMWEQLGECYLYGEGTRNHLPYIPLAKEYLENALEVKGWSDNDHVRVLLSMIYLGSEGYEYADLDRAKELLHAIPADSKEYKNAQSLLKEVPDAAAGINDWRHQNGVSKDGTVKKGCYVATCVYGSYDCPQVWTLRRFRDETLAATWYGRAFIRCYYAVSPTLVRLFGGQRWFRAVWKPRLDGMVRRLNGQGVADTPYQDRPW